MGACATKPKVKADEATIPTPAPEEPVNDMVKNTEEVKVVEEEKKKEDIEKVVLEEENPQSLASLLVEKEATPVVEVSSVTKEEEKPKAEEKPKVEPPQEAALVAVLGNATAEEVKESEEKETEKDEKSV